MDKQDLKALIGPEWMRVAEARKALADAVADIRQTAPGVEDYTVMGTTDLVPAVRDLVRSNALHDQEDNARRVSQAFTAHPGYLYARGIDELAFGTAVLWLRLTLHDLDAALNAAPDPE